MLLSQHILVLLKLNNSEQKLINNSTKDPERQGGKMTEEKNLAPAKEKSALELIFDESGKTGATARFIWRVLPETIKKLEEKTILHPFLLVTYVKVFGSPDVRWFSYKKERKLFPLEQGFGHIVFTSPETYFVMAEIVFINDNVRVMNDKRAVHMRLHSKLINSDHIMNLLDTSSDHKFTKEELLAGKAYVSHPYNFAKDEGFCFKPETKLITVDKEYFAKPPPKWLLWLDKFLPGEVVIKNQCDWRRRLLWMFLFWAPISFLVLLPIFLIFRTIGGLCYAFGLWFVGWRKINLNPLIHPFEDTVSKINSANCKVSFDERYDHNFYTRMNKNGEPRSLLATTMLAPYNWTTAILATSFTAFCMNAAHQLDPTWQNMTHSINPFIFWLLVVLVGVISVLLLDVASKYVFAKWSLAREKRQKEKMEKRALMLEKEHEKSNTPTKQGEMFMGKDHYATLRPLANIKTDSQHVNLGALPASHRTLHLRYTDLKAKVCKPFAR